LIPHNFLPRSQFDMDWWQRPLNSDRSMPSTLDVFDPFDAMDREMARNFNWLNRPAQLQLQEQGQGMLQQSVPPNKYRISLDCTGFSSNSIRIDLADDWRHLTVSGDENLNEGGKNGDDYTHRQFKRTWELPENVLCDQMVSFMTSDSQLVIEMPLREMGMGQMQMQSGFPKIIDGENNSKQVWMDIAVPQGLDPEHLKVTCKDRDLIVQAKEKHGDKDNFSQTSFYSRCTLPENTDFKNLKCMYDNANCLSIKAPLDLDPKHKHHKHKAMSIHVDNNKAIKN